MIASDIRRGAIILHNNAPHRVLDFNHLTPGNLKAWVQLKMRNLVTGNQCELKVGSGVKLEEADARTIEATYLYSDNDGYHFMLSESYEEITMTKAGVGEDIYYLQEQMKVDVTMWEGQALSLSLPSTVVLTIADTSPEIRGATASNSPKPAVTDTGLQLSVPPFIAQGERIIVRTEDGAYVSRAE